MAYGGKFPTLYVSRKLARKCHKNLGKRKRGLGRRGRRARGRSSEALPVLRFIVSISSILNLLAAI
jgi:hypothetical protein